MNALRAGSMPPLMSLLLLLGCGDGNGPGATELVLATDASDVTLDQLHIKPPPALTISAANRGGGSVIIRMCNNAGFPGPNLTLQQRDSTGHFVLFSDFPWITCFDPTDGYDLVLKSGDVRELTRLLAAPEPGEYRYRMTYITPDGKTGSVTSNTWSAHY
jgi:hypothetical protein